MPDLRRHHLFAQLLMPILALSISSGTVPADAAVVHCRDEAGRTHFQQFGCPPGATLITEDADTEHRLSVVVTAPLSRAEEQALERLERSLEKDRQVRATTRARAARERSARAAEDARRCREAEQKLVQLAETRRRGYRLKAAAQLDSEEAHWRAVRKAAC